MIADIEAFKTLTGINVTYDIFPGPEDMALFREAQPGVAPATLEVATPLHEKVIMMLHTPDGQEVLASMIGDASAPGSPVWIRPDVGRALLYDADTGLLDRRAAEVAEAAA